MRHKVIDFAFYASTDRSSDAAMLAVARSQLHWAAQSPGWGGSSHALPKQFYPHTRRTPTQHAAAAALPGA